jgi:UDP-glucose 4-epimerase
MRILITGGAGFIGSHLTDRLVADGHQITILDNLATGRKENLSVHLGGTNVTFIEGSILDLPRLDGLIKETEYVFHLAAAVGVFNIVNHPLDSLMTNIRGTENVLESAHKYSRPVFVTSSSEVYGKNISDSLKESDDRILGAPVTPCSY